MVDSSTCRHGAHARRGGGVWESVNISDDSNEDEGLTKVYRGATDENGKKKPS